MPFKLVKFAEIEVDLRKRDGFDRSPVLQKASMELNYEADDYRNYTNVVLHVRVRSDQEAVNLALDSFDVVRGLWNLYLNLQRSFVFTMAGLPEPVNYIRPGPWHTLHHKDGSLVSETFWFDPTYSRPGKSYKIDADMSKALKRNFLTPRRLLAHSPLAEDTYEAIRRYCRALDSWDLNQAFAQPWSALEYLTNTTEEPYHVTVRRAAARQTDYQLAVEILKHLQQRRNRLIHAARFPGDIETLVYQLKWMVEGLLRFFIVNPGKLCTRQEVGEFLDAPRDFDRLKRRIHVLSAYRRLRTAKPPHPAKPGKER
jgi:hypothetical protein